MTALAGRRLAVYVFLCLVWGSTWLVIKIGLRDLPPLAFAGWRMALACALLIPFAWRDRGRRPTLREALLIGWSGLLQIGLSYALIFEASRRIDSGLTALLFASFPIWVGLFGHWMLPREPLTRRALFAGALGLAGVAVIEAPALRTVSSAESRPLLTGGLLVLVSAIISAYANVLNKRSFAEVSPILNVWGQTLLGAGFLLAIAAAFERGAPARWTPGAIACLLYLAVFGTALGFLGLFWLIPRVPVAVVGTIPLADTLVAVTLGVIVLHERFSLRILAGGVMILAGVLLSTSERRTAELARAG